MEDLFRLGFENEVTVPSAKGFVEDRGQEDVEFSGNLGLQPPQRVRRSFVLSQGTMPPLLGWDTKSRRPLASLEQTSAKRRTDAS